jgi:hypothetical protein
MAGFIKTIIPTGISRILHSRALNFRLFVNCKSKGEVICLARKPLPRKRKVVHDHQSTAYT